MIQLEQITRLYGDTVAVNRLTLSVDQGTVCILIGPSGCGKTTTLRMINRLLQPTSGRILIDGKDVSTIKPEMLRRSMGYVIQNIGLFPHMTVSANIATVPELLHWDRERIRRRVLELLDLVGLAASSFYGKYPAELSGGEAQRIGVARALAADPPVLLMDEPFGAVDPITREKLQTQFLQIQKELHKTVIMVTHDLDEAIRLGDRIAVMRSGELIQYDRPEMILTRPANKFVHDFVGTDRALKRLSRLTVENYIRPAPSINVNATWEQVKFAFESCRWLWVVDGHNKLLGWLDKNMLSRGGNIADAMVKHDLEEIAVTPDFSLRATLSRMLGLGFKNIPVVDLSGQLIGEVELSAIEEATSDDKP